MTTQSQPIHQSQFNPEFPASSPRIFSPSPEGFHKHLLLDTQGVYVQPHLHPDTRAPRDHTTGRKPARAESGSHCVEQHAAAAPVPIRIPDVIRVVREPIGRCASPGAAQVNAARIRAGDRPRPCASRLSEDPVSLPVLSGAAHRQRGLHPGLLLRLLHDPGLPHRNRHPKRNQRPGRHP